jgi:adenosine deaminase
VRALEDPRLVARLREQRIPLTVCPLSNLKLRVFENMKQHNLKRLLEAGLVVTVNSDDPAYFGGYVNDNIRAVQDALDLSVADWHRVARNSFEASLVDDAVRRRWIAQLDAFVADEDRA